MLLCHCDHVRDHIDIDFRLGYDIEIGLRFPCRLRDPLKSPLKILRADDIKESMNLLIDFGRFSPLAGFFSRLPRLFEL